MMKDMSKPTGEENRSAGNLKVSNFHCSIHGYIKPEPVCPECHASPLPKEEEVYKELIAKLEGMKQQDIYWVEGNTSNPRMLEIVKNQGFNTALDEVIKKIEEMI